MGGTADGGQKKMRVKTSGFSLFELVLVLVVIGLLSAVAIPKYVQYNIAKDQLQVVAACEEVQNAFVLAQADIKAYPSVTVLASYVQGDEVAAVATGIRLNSHGAEYTVKTYSDAQCLNSTRGVDDLVRCVADGH